LAAAFSGLNRLLNNLRSANHDFVPTTEVFPPFNAEKVAAEMDLAALGASRGKNNLPDKDAGHPDEIEIKIAERVDQAKNTAFNNLEDQLHLFKVRLAGLDFDGQFSHIEKVNAESLTDFKGEIVKGKAELHTLRRNLSVADRDLANFQKHHKLDRGAISPAGSKQFMKWALLVLVFLFEWIGNGFFLAEGSRLGFIGGVLEAGLFSLLNVGGTAIITMFGIRNLIHRSIMRKCFGLIALVAYIAFAITLNLVLAHYRELSGNLIDGIGVEAFRRFMAAPLGLEDVKSWMLLGGGMFFSVVTALDVWSMGDPYMGYQAVHQRRVAAEDEYKRVQAELIDELIGLRDEHHEKVDQIIDRLKARRKDHSDIVAHRAKLLNLFKEYQVNLERSAIQMINIYRDANRSTRTDPPPKHFNQTFKMERMKPTFDKSGELSDKEIAASIKKAQVELTEQIKAIARACEEGIAEYRELDNLYPEQTSNG
jgi:hypothetical protein